jgi:hypothetical protein
MKKIPKEISRRLFIKGGTSRVSRKSPMPGKERIRVDGLGLQQRIAVSAAFSKAISWYGPDNRARGSWESFFSSDDTLLIGLISSLDIDRIKSRFQGENEKDAPDSTVKYRICCDLTRNIDDWLSHFQVMAAGEGMERPVAQRMKNRIEIVIREQLRPVFARLCRFESNGNGDDPHLLDPVLFSPVWQPGDTGSHWDPRDLDHPFYTLITAVTHIRKAARELFHSSMDGENHDPSAGLFICFLKLMERVRQRGNRFFDRYLDFYFYDVLKAVPGIGRPERTILLFQADRQGGEALVEKGRTFIREQRDKNDRTIFTADHNVRVTDTEVAALSTLYFEKNPYISPEKEMGFVTGIYQRTITVGTKSRAGYRENARQKKPEEKERLPLFGSAASGGQQEGVVPAALGLAVTSPVLRLKQGERHVRVDIRYRMKDPQKQDIIPMLKQRLKIKKGKDKSEGDGNHELGIKDLFFKVFERALTLSLTGKTGWIRIGQYLPHFDGGGFGTGSGCLSFTFHLGPDHGPVVPWDESIHKGDFKTGEPVLRLDLNPDAHACLYSFFSVMILEQIDITVNVKGHRDLVLYNDAGMLSAASPFALFGHNPDVGASFVVGSHEASNKNITRFDVRLEWDLPGQISSFSQYYKGYGRDEDTRFTTAVSTLTDGVLHPERLEDQDRFNLFSDRSGKAAGFDSILSPHVKICLGAKQFRLFRQKPDPLPKERFAFDSDARYGFVKMTLSGPFWGFGHQDYQGLLTKVLTRNALKKKAGIPEALPSVPWTPTVRQIQVDYCAVSHMAPVDGQTKVTGRAGNGLYHIHPWGVEKISGEKPAGEICFLPRCFQQPGNRFENSFVNPSYGSLFIGLSGSGRPGRISLFFDLQQDTGRTGDGNRPQIFWHYLSETGWKAVESHNILSDTTKGFLTPGIIILDLPQDITNGHTVMGGGFYWLKVSARGNLKSVCDFSGIYTHAVQVTRVSLPDNPDRDDDAPDSQALPAEESTGVIRTAKTAIPGVSRIVQAAGFFGGRRKETDADLKYRVRDRLRHKMRAVTAWDYERLVLEQFPGIFKVKCFPNMVSDKKDAFSHEFKKNLALSTKAGHVLVIAVADGRNLAQPGTSPPRLSRVVLERIKDFLTGHAPASARISVQNPKYEQVRVVCSVKFNRIESPGKNTRRLNHDIFTYLSPWHGSGYTVRFGWRIRPSDVKAFIQNLSYVDNVTGFSMLKVTDKTRDYYGLFDTEDSGPASGPGDIIQPFYPWSLAVPAMSHDITVMQKKELKMATATGINDLEVGSTFIIS